jgi:hypothetical protein
MPKQIIPTQHISQICNFNLKHIPKRFNILTVNKTLKRIKRPGKVLGMKRKMHKRTKKNTRNLEKSRENRTK